MIGGGLGRRRLKGLGGPWIGLEGREMVEKALLVMAAKEKRREEKGKEGKRRGCGGDDYNDVVWC